ncbi:hypothetical protein [Micromonospora arborensis]|uniref:hypothetical protein n=1 Tax=Micromonospora arborensis TaxID=2116518 RepID=UPI0037247AAC
MRNRTDQPRVHGYDRVTLIVRGNAMPPELAPARLPRERDRHTVVVAADPPLDLPTLTALLSHHLPVRCASIRLVLSESGRAGFAQVIADELRIEVLAPAGPVLLLPSGMLFVTEGQWWRFRPGAAGERQGARHPAPDWERLLALHPRVLPPGVRVTAVPAGLWLHDAEPPVPPLTTALLSLPVDPERPTVVIGGPAGAPLPPESVHATLEALPRALRRRMILLPYRGEVGTAGTVGEWSEPVVEPPPSFAAERQDDVPARSGVDAGRYTGAVFTGWPSEPLPDWRPGQELHTPEALTGTTAPRPPAQEPDGGAPAGPVLVIWSVSGQRVTDTGPQTGEQVRFAPGSRLRVVEVEHLGRDEPVLVLLRDTTADPAYESLEPDHDAALDRRARSALRRAVDAVRRTPATSAWPLSPGRGYRVSR